MVARRLSNSPSNFSVFDSLKSSTPVQIDNRTDTETVQINIDRSEDLQPKWAELERRVARKQPKKIGEGLQGRTKRRISAWDAEHV